MKTLQLHVLVDAVRREMQRSVPVFDDINYRVEHNLQSDVGGIGSKGDTLMRDARVNWFMLPFPLSPTLVSP